MLLSEVLQLSKETFIIMDSTLTEDDFKTDFKKSSSSRPLFIYTEVGNSQM